MLFTPSVWRQLLLALALASWVPAAVLLPFSVQAQPAQPADPGMRDYAIAGGPLGAVLGRFAAASGVVLSFDAALTDGLSSQGLHGRYSVRQGFDRLLQDKGLRVVETASGYRLGKLPASAGSRVSVLEHVTVRGNRSGRDEVYRTPGSVAVVTREDIDRLPPRNTSDVLAAIPGVMTANDRQNPGVRINIRGLEGMGRVNATIDGARQNYQQSGHTGGSSVYLDPELLAGVDVKLGPSSGVGGAGVIGGTVNFRTLTADDILQEGREYGMRINGMTGSNAYRFSGSVAGAWKPGESFDVAAAYSVKNVGEYTVGTRGVETNAGNVRPQLAFSDQDQKAGLFKARWRPSADHDIQFGYVGFRADYIDNDIISGQDSYANANRISADTLTLSHSWAPVNPYWHLQSSLWFARTTNAQFRGRGGSGSAGSFDVRYQTNTLGTSLENTSELPVILGFQPSVNYGAEFFADWTRPQASTEDGGDPYWFTGATPKGERQVASGFAELRMKRERLELIAGLRYDWYHLKGEGQVYVGRFANGQTAYRPFITDLSKGKLAPRLVASYALHDNLSVFASYSQGFRPPHITEMLMSGSHPFVMNFPYIPNPNLREETSKSWEVGAMVDFRDVLRSGDSLKAKLTGFYNDIDHYIITAGVLLPTDIRSEGLQLSMVNIQNQVRFYGLEFQTDYDADRWFVNASLTLTRRNLGDGIYDPFPLGSVVVNPDPGALGKGDGLDISTVPPELRYSIGAGLRFLDGRLETGVRMQYVGGRGARTDDGRNDSNWLSMLAFHNWSDKGYRTYDAWVRYQVSRDVRVGLSIQNLTNEGYVEALSTTSYMAPGRTVLLNVSIKF